MSIDNPKKILNHIYYDKLPRVYRNADSALGNYPLKRYLSALIEGGFADELKDINNVLDLISVEKCPEKFFPFLLESFGLEYSELIPEIYQRKLLSNISDIVKRRGTYSCVRVLIKSLTDLDCELGYERTPDFRYLDVILLASSIKELEEIEISKEVIKNYIQHYLPFYITPRLSSKIKTQVIKDTQYEGHTMSQIMSYQLGGK